MASSSPSASLCLLFLLFNRSTQRCSHATPHLGVQQGAQEHHACAQPVPRRERVLEVEDGDDEAEELSERDHQRDGERSALGGENEDAADANISEGTTSKPKQREQCGVENAFMFFFLSMNPLGMRKVHHLGLVFDPLLEISL